MRYEKQMKVIVTRPSPDAEAFAAAAARLGADPLISPVMAIRNREASLDLSGISALAFTSSNGVRAFAALSSERSFKVFAVGEATAAAATLAGFSEVDIATGDVESLSALILKSKPTRSVLHLAGSERAGDLVRHLSLKGVSARRAVIYEAVKIDHMTPEAARALSEIGNSSAVVLFSPRSARLFLDQARRDGVLDQLRSATAFCLSGEVAEEASESRWQTTLVAEERNAAAMLRLVERLIAGRKGRTGAPR